MFCTFLMNACLEIPSQPSWTLQLWHPNYLVLNGILFLLLVLPLNAKIKRSVWGPRQIILPLSWAARHMTFKPFPSQQLWPPSWPKICTQGANPAGLEDEWGPQVALAAELTLRCHQYATSMPPSRPGLNFRGSILSPGHWLLVQCKSSHLTAPADSSVWDVWGRRSQSRSHRKRMN